jgi:TRAP-type C4-dicarboxylate transport system permease small subunit
MEVPMPELVRLYIRSVAFGFGIAVVFTAGVIWLDVAGVGHLILGSDIGWVAALMMVFFNGIIFGAVQFAYRIMGMAEDDGKSGGKGIFERAAEPVLIPVTEPAKTQRRR